jgi:hypothetical protein
MTTRKEKPGCFDHDDAWVASGAINADYTSSAIDCRGRDRVDFQLVISHTSDPIADLYFQGSVDGTNYVNCNIEENKMFTSDTTAITHTTAARAKVVINDPAAAASILVSFKNPKPFMRFFYDRTSGGSATGLSASYQLTNAEH